ncbi:hypothetical protein DCC85_05665 [Paenibacillus sp. CAA11]|uniref:ABC transporter permease n=1 Tax=Paenibacillus sp. CAA11 TaxID=1532905 RepID=UPI000D35C199|nr:ABC transporter permease [Paenibacillus sp. CAA11]AWB43758.1 hypothetical protein DCC85_05665 [Paenibacillus sp. CAA11]
MNRLIRLMLLDIKLLAKSKVFYLKLILLPLALILILGSMFGGSASERTEAESATQPIAASAPSDVPIVTLHSGSTAVQALPYEAAAMTVLFSILTAFELAHGIIRDKQNHTFARIRSTPTSGYIYALGKLASMTLAIVVQMLVVIIASRLIFGVRWGNWADVLLIACMYGLAIGGIVLCFGLAARDHTQISSFATPILYGFGFLGGSFIDKYSLPSGLQTLQQLLPNGKAMNAFLAMFQGGTLADIYKDLLILAAIGLIFFLAALWLMNGRRIPHANPVSHRQAAEVDAE